MKMQKLNEFKKDKILMAMSIKTAIDINIGYMIHDILILMENGLWIGTAIE